MPSAFSAASLEQVMAVETLGYQQNVSLAVSTKLCRELAGKRFVYICNINVLEVHNAICRDGFFGLLKDYL